MDIKLVVNQMLELFLILALGYIAAKKKVVSPNFGSQLSNFILSITLPCMMLASVATMPADNDSKDINDDVYHLNSFLCGDAVCCLFYCQNTDGKKRRSTFIHVYDDLV